ncbi:type II secretion system F family protein [Agromyces sp. ISL-38]|uniref:type II secretion system F family protein n=1 Tax=Agromyces sp. ISL-38 TaxID=2819107 RepID=UPI001BE9B11C|nr:type II secretion system F family protein [Agromyces sp. ISL-38]MBT2500750.1 type II secretion system F family protein [Agromyces sp. ISL-38]
MTPFIGIIAAALTAVGIGLLVGILVGWRSPKAVEGGVDDATMEGELVQRSTFSESLVAAAPKGYVGWIDRQILWAGRPIGWTVTKIFTWKIILAAVAILLGVLFISGDPQPMRFLLSTGAAALAFFAADVLINSRAHDRQGAIQRSLPDTLDQMTIAVEAGLGFDAAMAKAGQNGRGPLAEELIRTLQDMSIGRTRRDAYLALEQRTNSEDLRRFVRAVQQADSYGVAVADVLRVQAGEMRIKRRQRAEEQAMKVPVKIVFPLVFCILPVLFIVIMTPAVIGLMRAFS